MSDSTIRSAFVFECPFCGNEVRALVTLQVDEKLTLRLTDVKSILEDHAEPCFSSGNILVQGSSS